MLRPCKENRTVLKDCLTIDLGMIGYAEAYALQKRIVAARKAGAIEDVLLLCEHPPVITLGRSGKRENLLASEHVLRQKGVEFHPSDRGGDITYHGPGQIVGYPILSLGAIRRDVVWYVRTLEEAMIRATAEFGIAAERIPGKTGIWVRAGNTEEKLAAIGVHISRWVTSHGFAYNVSTDLRNFDLIVPFAELRPDRAMRDRGPESDFAGEIAGAPSRRKRSRAADREASRRLARAGDEASVEERITGEAGPH